MKSTHYASIPAPADTQLENLDIGDAILSTHYSSTARFVYSLPMAPANTQLENLDSGDPNVSTRYASTARVVHSLR